MAGRLQSVFSMFQTNRENGLIKQNVAPKQFGQGVKRAPLGNIGNKVVKKMAVEKSKQDDATVAIKTAVPMCMEDNVDDYDVDTMPMDTDEQPVEDAMAGLQPVPAAIAAAPTAVFQLPAGISDIDAGDVESPEFAIDYVNDIYSYLHEQEIRFFVGNEYLTSGAFTANMRTVLIEWLIQVHQRFQLAQETLYLTVSLVDRFMSKTVVSHDKIQLVGVAALLVASKYEDTYPPHLKHLCALTEDAYTKEQVIDMEQLLLSTLDFDLGCPLSLHFLRRGSRAAYSDCYIHGLSKYLLELALPHASMMSFLPSKQAAASLHVSREVFKLADGWNPTIQFYTGYSLDDIMPCVDALKQLLKESNSSPFQVVQKKWAHSRNFKISRYDELIKYIETLP